jgi:trans-2,3-dihydro-3-hydroxyanthranilate isomerase
MTEYRFETVDVFTTVLFGGNPLAVFPDARGLDAVAMQRIAREFNLSETTFVFPPADPAHTAHVRIFTPMHELPFAGHPNVGTALVLATAAGDRPGTMLFEEAAGLVRMVFDWSGEHPRATLDAPVPLAVEQTIPVETIAACAGLEPRDVLSSLHEPVVAGVGTFFVIAEVTAEALGRAVPDATAIAAAAKRYPGPAIGFPVHLHASTERGRRTRMFAPLSGIVEDPATGSANVALAALLLSVSGADEMSIVLEQGVEMGRPSTLYAGARRAADGVRSWIGGSAVPVLRGSITV